MSFKVSWIFDAINKFSPVAKKISRDAKGIDDSTKKAARSIIKKNTALRKLKATLIKAQRNLRKYRKETKASERATKAFTGRLKKLAAFAVAGLGLAALIREGAKFQDSIADLSSITGQGGAALASMKKEVKDLAIATRIMPAEVAKAFTQVASAKSELLETEGAVARVTKQALLLANAAGIEIPEAVKASVGALNQFGQGADQAARFVNVIAAGAKVGASVVAETAEALKNVGAVASNFNVTFEETNSLIQVLAKNEIKGAEAGTKLRGALLALETGTKGKLQPSVIGIVAALKGLQAAGLDNVQMAKLFGAENITAGLILRDNIPLIEKWTKELTGTNVAQNQATTRMATFSSEVRGAQVRIAVLASTLFDQATPALSGLSGAVLDFIKGLDPSDVETFGIILSGLGRIAQGVAVAFGAAFRVIMTIIKPVFAVLKGIGTLIGQIVGAIASLDFSQFDLGGALSLGGKFLGLFGGEEGPQQKIAEQAAAATANATATETTNNNVATSVSPQTINNNVAPSVSPQATINSNSTLNGQITVSATNGSKVESVNAVTTTNNRKQKLNLGIGAAAGA